MRNCRERERERERERKRERERLGERGRERGREGGRESERERKSERERETLQHTHTTLRKTFMHGLATTLLCITLQQTVAQSATHTHNREEGFYAWISNCNALLYTPQHTHTTARRAFMRGSATATHCNTLQHTATHCNTLQHTAT